MKKHGRMMLTVLVIISQLCSVLTLETTGSAFMWSPHIDRELDGKVNYQTLSSRDLARSIMSDGSWSNILCEGERAHPPVDIAVVFVGKELQLSGITNSGVDSSLVNLLKEYVVSRMEEGIKEQTDLLVVCRGVFSSSIKFDRPHSEGGHLSELLSSLDHSGAKYTVLYVSDPYSPIQYPLSHQIGRLLAEDASGNASLNSTAFCDGICQVKKTLLEAIFVAIVLLIILIRTLLYDGHRYSCKV